MNPNEPDYKTLKDRLDDAEKEIKSLKKDVETAQEGERGYKTMLDIFPHSAIFLFDKDLFCKLYGGEVIDYLSSSKTKIIGEHLSNIYPPEISNAVEPLFLEMLKSGKTVKCSFIYKDRIFDGYIVPSKVTDHGISEGVAFLIDKTDQKILDDKIKEIQRMEAVGRLAGGIAHEFNNMLSIIIGNTELALNNTEKVSKTYYYLEQIQKAAKRSSEFTKQLLGYARKQTISPTIINLNKYIEDILGLLRSLIGEHINLIYIPTKDLCHVYIDPVQIDQIITNLCANARDSITDGGNIIIETSLVNIDNNYCSTHPDSIPDNYVMLSISDNGCGIDKESIGNLFDPFFTTKETGKGTGLGLSTVYGIVKQNKGFINVYSEINKGSTFKVYLPAHNKEITNNVQGKPHQSNWLKGKETILVVEDEKTILDMLKGMLELLGYKIIIADIPNKAIDIVKEFNGKIDLLITDIVMPEMNGKELLKKITEFQPEIKTLFMSGYSSNVISHHGIIDKEFNFIQKPFSIDTFSSKVREILDN